MARKKQSCKLIMKVMIKWNHLHKENPSETVNKLKLIFLFDSSATITGYDPDSVIAREWLGSNFSVNVQQLEILSVISWYFAFSQFQLMDPILEQVVLLNELNQRLVVRRHYLHQRNHGELVKVFLSFYLLDDCYGHHRMTLVFLQIVFRKSHVSRKIIINST